MLTSVECFERADRNDVGPFSKRGRSHGPPDDGVVLGSRHDHRNVGVLEENTDVKDHAS
jgi:hypothetical protein